MAQIFAGVKRLRLVQGLSSAGRWVGRGLFRLTKGSIRPAERVEALLDGVTHEKRAKAAEAYAKTAVTINTLDGKTRQENALAETMENASAESWVELYNKCQAAGLELERDPYGKPLIYKTLADGSRKVLTGFVSGPQLSPVESSIPPSTKLIA